MAAEAPASASGTYFYLTICELVFHLVFCRDEPCDHARSVIIPRSLSEDVFAFLFANVFPRLGFAVVQRCGSTVLLGRNEIQLLDPINGVGLRMKRREMTLSTCLYCMGWAFSCGNGEDACKTGAVQSVKGRRLSGDVCRCQNISIRLLCWRYVH